MKMVQIILEWCHRLDHSTNWHSGETCWFPKQNWKELSKDENTVPDRSYIAYNCSLKRDGIETYMQASEIANIMAKLPDSDQSDVDTSSTSRVLMSKGTRTIAKVS